MAGVSTRDFGTREDAPITDLETGGDDADNHTLMGLTKGMLAKQGEIADAIDEGNQKLDDVITGIANLNDAEALVYYATFAAVGITAAQDAFAIVAGTKRVSIRAAMLSQYSDFGDAAAEILSVTIVRGNTVVGSGGGAFTPLKARPSMPPASATVRINDTTVATGGTAETLVSDMWNVAAGFIHQPSEAERIWLEPGQRACVRITAPADSLTSNGTLVFEEVAL